MKKTMTLRERITSYVSVAAITVASIAPAILGAQTATALTVTERKITLSTSKVSTSATYDVSFKPSTSTGNAADDIKGIVVDFCQDSPLVGTTCTKTNGVTAVPTSSTVNVSHTGATGTPVSFTVNDPTGSSNDGNQLVLTSASGLDVITPANTITFSFTATNPSATGTFYARILTYNTTGGATGYSDTAPGTHLDDGGVALSTANQLTVSARVQEQLQFCVGTTSVDDATTSVSTNCSVAFTGSQGNSVDLGVLDNNAVYVSGPSNTASADNGVNGAAMVRTNANLGVIVSFYPEAGSGTNHTRALRVTGVTCTADAFPSTSNTDQCFNSANSTQGAFTAGTENFGMTIAGTNCGSTTAYSCSFAGSTNKLVPGTEWNGSGAGTFGTAGGFAWHENSTATTIATSTSVVDDEALMLKFAGTANITTPTGVYGVTSTYIATATF